MEDLIEKAIYHRNYLRIATPDMRNIYLKNAIDSFHDGKVAHSVYLLLETLCFSYNTKIQQLITTQLPASKICLPLEDKSTHSNPLIDYAKENFTTGKDKNLINHELPKFNIEKEYQKIIDFRNTLPKEWTVVQITKDYNPEQTIFTESNNSQSEFPIYFTIIKSPRNSEFPSVPPITIKLNENYNNIFSKFFHITREFKQTICYEAKSESCSKQKYSQEMHIFADQINKTIENFVQFIGPWIALISGNVHQSDELLQKEIFKEVDIFCNKHDLNDTAKILLSMLASYPKCLTEINCKIATKEINKNGNAELSKHINNFLVAQKNRKEFGKPLKPCLLIIDEMLDHFPWEMLNKSQEICRLSSFEILQQLYTRHTNKIKNGYVQVGVINGNGIINPEKNLDSMELRMKLFFDYWLPNWKYIYGEIPSTEEITKIFSTDDIYVFCGHGSGMQYLNVYKNGIQEIKKSVIFLFGCESVKLKSSGLHSELYGEHLYFHYSLCPAVVGFNHVGLDFPLDDYLSQILSTWINSDQQQPHWSSFQKSQWKKGKLVTVENKKNADCTYEPRLAAILSHIRSDPTQQMFNIVSLVYRGLPVYNSKIRY